MQTESSSSAADVAIAASERLIVFVSAPGAGKADVMRAWEELQLPASSVRRIRRVVTGVSHLSSTEDELVNASEFQALFAAGTFAASWYARGRSFGVRRSELATLGAGQWRMLSGSRVHLSKLRQHAPRLHLVEVTASLDVRKARLLLSDGPGADRPISLDPQPPKLKADLVVTNDGKPVSAAQKVNRWWLSLLKVARASDVVAPRKPS